jgi:hypothetical protein
MKHLAPLTAAVRITPLLLSSFFFSGEVTHEGEFWWGVLLSLRLGCENQGERRGERRRL